MKYSGDEFFKFNDTKEFTLSSFWSWFASDLLNNVTRGVLAEYIVHKALRLNTDEKRRNWDPFDLTFDGVPVEVKSSAYIQSWQEGDKLSTPAFGIHPTYYEYEHGEGERARKAKIYIFCLLDCKDRAAINPLELKQWKFFVLPTSVLNEKCGAQKTITLNSLVTLGAAEANYGNLKSAVEQCIKQRQKSAE